MYKHFYSIVHTAQLQSSAYLLTLGAHAQEGYGTCLVCVCSHSSVNIVRFYSPSKVHVRTAFV